MTQMSGSDDMHIAVDLPAESELSIPPADYNTQHASSQHVDNSDVYSFSGSDEGYIFDLPASPVCQREFSQPTLQPVADNADENQSLADPHFLTLRNDFLRNLD